MNILLIFFALPIAVIIVSAILEKLLKSPVAVASLIFAIFLVVTFAVFDETFLIATLAFTIIAFITALIVHFLKDRKEEHNICEVLREVLQNNNINNNIITNNNECDEDSEENESIGNTIGDLLGKSSNNIENTNNCNCVCNRYRKK